MNGKRLDKSVSNDKILTNSPLRLCQPSLDDLRRKAIQPDSMREGKSRLIGMTLLIGMLPRFHLIQSSHNFTDRELIFYQLGTGSALFVQLSYFC